MSDTTRQMCLCVPSPILTRSAHAEVAGAESDDSERRAGTDFVAESDGDLGVVPADLAVAGVSHRITPILNALQALDWTDKSR